MTDDERLTLIKSATNDLAWQIGRSVQIRVYDYPCPGQDHVEFKQRDDAQPARRETADEAT